MGYERLVKATTARTLEWSQTEERAVDQIAAIGLATRKDEFGSAILRMEALNAPATRKVIYLIRRRLIRKFRIEDVYARKVGWAVLHEYLRGNCSYCGGSGEIHEEGAKVIQCPYCAGTGLHRFSDTERAGLLGGRKYNQKVYEDALAYLRDSAREIVRKVHGRLEEPIHRG
jgi:hypothetical protein